MVFLDISCYPCGDLRACSDPLDCWAWPAAAVACCGGVEAEECVPEMAPVTGTVSSATADEVLMEQLVRR